MWLVHEWSESTLHHYRIEDLIYVVTRCPLTVGVISSSHYRLCSYETDKNLYGLPPASGDLRPPPFQPPCLPAAKWKPVNSHLEELASQPDVKQPPQPTFLNWFGDWTGKLQSWKRDKNLEPTSRRQRSTETREEDWGVTKTQVDQNSKKIIRISLRFSYLRLYTGYGISLTQSIFPFQLWTYFYSNCEYISIPIVTTGWSISV